MLSDAFNVKKLAPFFAKRREVLKSIPNFWPTVIRGASSLLDPFMTMEDIDLLLKLKDLFVEWDKETPTDFTITLEFEPNEYLEDDSLVLKKTFKHQVDNMKDEAEGEKADEEDEEGDGFDKLQSLMIKKQIEAVESYTSEPVEIKWKKGKNLTKVKDTGINSFFGFFNFLGEGPGDFVSGEELADAIQGEIFPHAPKLYIDGLLDQLTGEDEYEVVEDEDNEEDIGDDEEDEVKGKKHKKDSDDSEAPAKKKAKKD